MDIWFSVFAQFLYLNFYLETIYAPSKEFIFKLEVSTLLKTLSQGLFQTQHQKKKLEFSFMDSLSHLSENSSLLLIF